MTYTPKHLRRWTMPDSYFGAEWHDYYSSGFGRSRDSSDLEESNFHTALTELGGESDTVLVIRESHWAVGWVEWIAIHESDSTALEKADALQERMENYPVLDENDWSNREYEHAQETWKNCSLQERVEMCRGDRISIFAARREWIPEEDSGRIFEQCRGG